MTETRSLWRLLLQNMPLIVAMMKRPNATKALRVYEKEKRSCPRYVSKKGKIAIIFFNLFPDFYNVLAFEHIFGQVLRAQVKRENNMIRPCYLHDQT